MTLQDQPGGADVATRERRSDPTSGPTQAPALRFAGVGMQFDGGVEALADIDIEVGRGEMVAIVGPSGCGKSTLLRIASGLQRPTAGTVEVGTDRLGYVFQDATLLPWRTVRANVELFCQLHGVPKAERRAKAQEALRVVGLEGFADAYPKTLSGGMRMRVSLARSLTLDPDVFLFDEPFGALDELTREHLNDKLLELFLLEAFAGVFVTHSVFEAVYLASKVVVMSARPGRVVDVVDVDLPYPRSQKLRHDPSYGAYTAKVSAALREGTR